MKLIIDIPEEDYKESTDHLRGFNEKALKEPFMIATLRDRLDIALLYGTPLDDVKAEIDEQYDRIRPYNIDVAQGLEMALDILDRIGKAESETN